MGRFISPKLDIVFKAMFVNHTELLPSFLSAVLEVPEDSLSEIRVINSDLLPIRKRANTGVWTSA